MAGWLFKEESRRYFRYDLEVPLSFQIKQHISTTEIFNNGIQYHSSLFKRRFDDCKSACHQELQNIHKHKDVIKTITSELIDRFNHASALIEKLSKGTDPQKDEAFWLHSQSLNSIPGSLEKIKLTSPESYRLFHGINDKYLSLLFSLQHTFIHSDENALLIKELKGSYQIDERLKKFNSQKHKGIPLVRYFFTLNHTLDLLIEVYRSMVIDHKYSLNPEKWDWFSVNLSACGARIKTLKEVDRAEKVELLLNLPGIERTTQFDCSIVSHRSKNSKNDLVLDFQFPDGKEQDLLISYLQRQELNRSIQIHQRHKNEQKAS